MYCYPGDTISYQLTAYTIDNITYQKLNNSITNYYIIDPPENISFNETNGKLTYKIPTMKEIDVPTDITLKIGCENTFKNKNNINLKINILKPEELESINEYNLINAYPTDTISYKLLTNNDSNIISYKILFNGYDPLILINSSDIPISSDLKVFNNHTYAYIATKKTWQQAKECCELLGGHLAVILNEETNEFIKNNVYYCTDNKKELFAWIGGYKHTNKSDTGKTSLTWKWITDDEMNYTNFQITSYINGDGMGLYLNKNNSWADYNENNTIAFICEWDSIITEIEDIDNISIPNNFTYNNNNGSISWNIPYDYIDYKQYSISIIAEDKYGQILNHYISVNIEEPPDPIIETEIADIAYMEENYSYQIIAYTPIDEDNKITDGNTYYIMDQPDNMSINSNTGIIYWNNLDLNTPYPYIEPKIIVKNKYGKITNKIIKIPTSAPRSYLPSIDQTYSIYTYYRDKPIEPIQIEAYDNVTINNVVETNATIINNQNNDIIIEEFTYD